MAEPPASGWRRIAALKVESELTHWRRLGLRPRLWWRDDDAREPTDALDRLLVIAGGRPLALAVVPAGDLHPLAVRLTGERSVSIGQHGVDHVNRRPAGEVKSEYGHPPPIDLLTDSLNAGKARLEAAGLAPSFYTPPWNAIDSGLPRAVRRVGYPMLSAGADRVLYSGLHYTSAEIDVLAWKGGARSKGAMRIMTMIGQALAERRRSAEYERPVGLLTHHLDHDEATWRFLAWSMEWFDTRFDWISTDQLLRHQPAPTAAARLSGGIEPMAQPVGV